MRAGPNIGSTIATFVSRSTHKVQSLDLSVLRPFNEFYNASVKAWALRNPEATANFIQLGIIRKIVSQTPSFSRRLNYAKYCVLVMLRNQKMSAAWSFSGFCFEYSLVNYRRYYCMFLRKLQGYGLYLKVTGNYYSSTAVKNRQIINTYIIYIFCI